MDERELSSFFEENDELKSTSMEDVSFDPSLCMVSSMGYNSLENAFKFSRCSSSMDSISPSSGHHQENQSFNVTSNSPVSSSSAEENTKNLCEDKETEDGGESSKKPKSKGEKRPREPRIAFMTRTEMEQLEDGYRWRKYGQKAVKNSPYPRSYYRCTTQRCTVKKRVERSSQDPSFLITTYEAKHNHPIPTALSRAASASASASFLFSGMFSPPRILGHEELLTSMQSYHEASLFGHGHSNYCYHHRSQEPVPDYGLLQDIVPSSMFMKPEP